MTEPLILSGVRQELARGMIADGMEDELAQTFAPALACTLAMLDCRGWRVRLEARTRHIVAVRL